MDRKKNTILIVILIAAAMIIVAAGVIGLSVYMEQKGEDKKGDITATSTAVKADENTTEDGAVADYVQSGSLKLGNYVGLEVDTEPTADEILEAMEPDLAEMTEKRKGKIKNGDYVCVTYKGYIDGQEYEELSDKNVVLRVGDYEMGKDFEKSLIGKEPGDKVTPSVTYDDSYEELSGETVDYKITIKGRFDDYYANKFSEGKYPTVDKYIAGVTETVRAQNRSPEIAGEVAWDTVMEDSEVLKYPEGMVDEEIVNTKKQYEEFAELQGVSLEELLEGFGMTEDELLEIAQDTVKERMITKTIMAKEQLVLDNATYEKYLLDCMEETGDSGKTLDELEKEYKEGYGEHPKDDMMLRFVQDFVGGKAKLA